MGPLIIGVDAWGLSGPARFTGMGQYAETLIAGIARLTDTVHVIAYGAVEEAVPGWLPVSVEWRPAARALHPKVAAIESRLRELPRLSLTDRLDVFHAPAVHVRPSSPPVPKLRCPVVATVHDVIPLAYYGRDLPARLRVFYRWNLSRALRSDAVLTVSEDSKRQIAELAHVDARRIDVIPNAVDFEPNPDPAVLAHLGVTAPYVLYTGSYEPRKNLAGALRAFKAFADAGHAHELVALVERSSGHEPAARRLLAELGLERRVRLLHSLDKRDLRALYTLAGCVLFPSFAEGFGLPLVQAQACGTPVVASDLPVLHEVGGDSAVYVDPTDPAAMAAALAGVLARTASEGRSPGRLPARFAVDHFVRAHLEIYARLAGRPAPALARMA